MNFKKLTKLAGDASSRKFYRDKKKKYVVVLSKKEKKINLLIYAAINKMFSSENILAPKLISENYKKPKENTLFRIQNKHFYTTSIFSIGKQYFPIENLSFYTYEYLCFS